MTYPPATPPEPPRLPTRALAPPACGHDGRQRAPRIRLFKFPGFQANYILRKITAGEREMVWRNCSVVVAPTPITPTARSGGEEPAGIGADPEVIRSALYALIDQPGVEVFSLVVDAQNGQRSGPASYVILRHHLPAFLVDQS